MPQTRKKFWKTKIERNKERDKEVNKYYKKLGWKFFRIWEHDLKKYSEKEDDIMVKYLKNGKKFKKIIETKMESINSV